jgi:hypothetical protein
MTWVFIIVIAALMGLTVLSLIRGIVAFLQSTRADLNEPESAGPSEMQLKQSKMMFRRIMYQGAAIFVVVLMMMASQK